MSETPSITQTPAQEIGLADGQFLVRRSDGQIEQGWQVHAVGDIPMRDNPDEVISAVQITRQSDEGDQVLSKTIPLDELQSWQPQPQEDMGLDADTIPREQIQEIGSEAVQQVVNEPIPVPLNKSEKDSLRTTVAIEDAVFDEQPTSDELITQEPTVDNDSQENVVPSTEVTAHDQKVSEKDQFEANPHAVAEIAERLGIPNESEPKVVEDKLREQVAELDTIARSLYEFAPMGARAAREIHETLSDGVNRLTGSSRAALNQYLEGPYNNLRALALDDARLTTMPGPLRQIVRDMQSQIAQFGEQSFVMMGGNMPRNYVGAFDTYSAGQVARTLRQLEEVAQRAAQSRLAAEDELNQVIGMKRANEEHEVQQAEKQPRPDVFDVLERAEKTDTKAIKIKGELQKELAASLGGITTQEPSENDVQHGVAVARAKIAEGRAEAELGSKPFMEWPKLMDDKIQKREIAVWLDKPIYIDSEQVIGAAGFDSWMGRGSNGKGSVSRREGNGGARWSIEQIKDYATRDTRLPELGADGGLTVVMAKNGTFVFSQNAHRVAAAKLRGEPVAVTAFDIVRYDDNL